MVSARVAVFTVFALNGAALGSWAPRVPALAVQVEAEPGPLSLAILGASVGLLVAALLSGRLVERYGPRTVLLVSVLAACAILPAIGAAPSLLWLGIALFLLGFTVGVVDVAMNIGAVVVERGVGKAIMPLFHAGFSVGGLVGSAAAGFAASHGWSPARHLTVAAVVAVVVLLVVVRGLPGAAPRTEAAQHTGRAPARRPVLWLLAGIALCSAIAEGASTDWSALLLVTEHGLTDAAAALAFSVFSLTMAATRLAGSWIQRRFGARRMLVVSAVTAGAGLLLAALVTAPVAGFIGFGLAGIGLAASFPVALGLAGEAGRRADGGGGEREIAFVTAIAYTGFLAGPPLIGGIAQVTSMSTSFVVVALIASCIAPSAVAAMRAGDRERTPVG
ncbi:MFS transporter [Amycolatopsis suaedae]|uniref:MFS transporter n=1 Tax=Amycolatopsis suaedae TaxID=2510978 RepID=UPI001F10B72F|nr:MFS transporter [Amycolatopsis suaedae]